jgi:hypothetical protein
MIVMPLTYSITDGIGAGFITWALLKLVKGKWREIHWLMAVVTSRLSSTSRRTGFSSSGTDSGSGLSSGRRPKGAGRFVSAIALPARVGPRLPFR